MEVARDLMFLGGGKAPPPERAVGGYLIRDLIWKKPMRLVNGRLEFAEPAQTYTAFSTREDAEAVAAEDCELMRQKHDLKISFQIMEREVYEMEIQQRATRARKVARAKRQRASNSGEQTEGEEA